MKKQKTPHIKSIRLFFTLTLILSLVSQVFTFSNTYASQITARSMTLLAGDGGDGGSMVGGVVKHEIKFTVPTTADIGSIKFDYCTTAAGACVMPTGLVTTAATLDFENGASGFTIDNTANGSPFITRVAASIPATTELTYRLANVTNPTTIISQPTIPNQTFFVRISTFTGIDGATGVTDTGTVAASTNDQIVLDGTMPESLVFCTGATIGKTATIPDCGTATSGAISFNQLFSPTDTATATSQMAASTNAGSGYVITVNGPTLESGGNSILGMGTQTTGAKGISQFGLNLKANTTTTSTVAIGAEIDVPSNGTNYRGQAATGYETVDNFKFVSGDAVANSADGGAGGSDAQIYTVSYIVNVPGSQPAGTYTTTLTYICTPTF